MTYLVTFEGESNEESDALDNRLDAVMEALLDGGARDPDIGAALTRGSFEISLRIDAERIEDAVSEAARIVRDALHEAGADAIRFAQARASDDTRTVLAPA